MTFLFTDIEGSTRLWERHPEATKLALAQHDALMGSCVEGNQGVVVKTTGDGCHAVFRRAAEVGVRGGAGTGGVCRCLAAGQIGRPGCCRGRQTGLTGPGGDLTPETELEACGFDEAGGKLGYEAGEVE